MPLSESNDYENILLNSSGLLDVRAPIEYRQGAFPNACNYPLLNDNERRQVGLCYKNKGHEQALDLGHDLISGETRQYRIQQWINFARQHNNAYLYCFRGGLRSKISQQWLHDAGIDIPRVSGGYKALRQHVLNTFSHAENDFDFILLGGLTGCRKTTLIKQLKHGIDLEGAANHRGSSFGAHASAQKSQIDFENQLAVDLMLARHKGYRTVALEDEGRFIGSVDIPKNIFVKMRSSPLVVVEDDIETRLNQLLDEYVIEMEIEFVQVHSEPHTAFEHLSQYLLGSLAKINKRLGDQRYKKIQNSMQDALLAHQRNHDVQQHMNWLKPLLQDYYDPMYMSQLAKREDSIIFRGSYNECQEYLNQYNQMI